MIFKTIEDEATASGMRITNIFAGVGERIHAVFQHDKGLVMPVNEDVAALNNYTTAITNGASATDAFAQYMTNASESAKSLAIDIQQVGVGSVAALERIKQFEHSTRMADVATMAQNKSLGNVRSMLNEYNNGMINCKLSQEDYIKSVGTSNPVLGKYLASVNTGSATMRGYVGALLSAETATIGLRIATTALNMAIGMGVGLLMQLVMSGIQKGIEAIAESMKSAAEKAEDYIAKVKELKDELDGLEHTLEKTKARIQELKDKNSEGTLTLVEKDELGRLERELSMTERLIELKRQDRDEESRKANAALMSAYGSKVYAYGHVNDIHALGADVAYNYGLDATKANDGSLSMIGTEAYVKELIAERQELIALSEKGIELTDEQKDRQTEVESILGDISQDIGDIISKYDLTVADEEGKEFVDTLNDVFDTIWKATNAASYFEAKLNSFSGDGSSVFAELSEDGKITAEEIENIASSSTDGAREFNALIQEMREAGYSTEYLVAYLNSLIASGKGASVATNTVVAEIHKYAQGINVLIQAIKEMDETGNISLGTYNKLIQMYPTLRDQVINTGEGYYFEDGALNKLLQTEATQAGYVDKLASAAAAIIDTEVKKANAYDGTTASILKQIEAQKALIQAKYIGSDSYGVSSRWRDLAKLSSLENSILNYNATVSTAQNAIKYYGNGTSSGSSSAAKEKSEFEKLYEWHQHLLKMEQESEKDYLNWLDAAYKQAYASGQIDLDNYYKYMEEVYTKRKQLEESALNEAKSATKKLIDYRIQMLKQEMNDEKDKLKEREEALKDFYDKQKEMLDDVHDHEEYLEKQAEKRKAVADLQFQLAQIENDNSAWAAKRRLELQEELSDANKELRDFEKEQALKDTKELLDDEYEAKKKQIDDEIDLVDKRLKDEKSLYERALADVKNGSVKLYQEMIDWNNVYGDGISQTITDAWNDAYIALQKYKDLYGSLYNGIDLANAGGAVYNPTPGGNAGVYGATGTYGTVSGGGGSGGLLASQTTGLIKVGARGDQVRAIQTALMALGYGNYLGADGVDGVFGSKTAAAVKAFQHDNGISVDGVVGDNTRAKFRARGYWRGTSNASSGLSRLFEMGDEYVFTSSDGSRYKMFSGGEKVLNAKATEFLYNFANNGSNALSKMLDGFAGRGLLDKLRGKSGDTVVQMGDIIVHGNADERTVSSIRREQRRATDYMLKELIRLKT